MRRLLLLCLCVSAAGSAAAGPGVIEIDHPEAFSRVVAVSDAHGMADPLKALLRAGGVIDARDHWAGGSTLLIVVGDSIDKGPDSVAVVDLWRSLQPEAAAAGGRLVHLLGNHEAEFLADPQDKKAKAFRQELKAKGIPIEDFTDPGRPRAAFLRAEPVAARVGKWLFAHAGLLPAGRWADFTAKAASLGGYDDDLLLADDSILEAKAWWADAAQRADLESRLSSGGLYGVVFGHQPKALGVEGACARSTDGRLIKIDNGMPPEAGAYPGSLLVFPHPADLATAAPPQALTIPAAGGTRPLAVEAP